MTRDYKARPRRRVPADVSGSPHQAALAFHAAALEELRSRDLPTTQALIAELIGECPSTYSRALHGTTGSLDRVARWISYWQEKGGPDLELVVRTGSTSVRLVETTD